MELTTNRLINQKYLSKLWPARLVRQRTEQVCLQTGTSFCMHSFCHSSGYFVQMNQSKTFNGPGDVFFTNCMLHLPKLQLELQLQLELGGGRRVRGE